jgi:hypothetical protein
MRSNLLNTKKRPVTGEPGMNKAGRAIKTYAKNVAGGAKIVGSAVKRAAQKVF